MNFEKNAERWNFQQGHSESHSIKNKVLNGWWLLKTKTDIFQKNTQFFKTTKRVLKNIAPWESTNFPGNLTETSTGKELGQQPQYPVFTVYWDFSWEQLI